MGQNRAYEPSPAELWVAPVVTLTSTVVETTLRAISSVDKTMYVEHIAAINTSAVAMNLIIRDGNAGTIIDRIQLGAGADAQRIYGRRGRRLTKGANLRVECSAAVASVFVSANGHELGV